MRLEARKYLYDVHQAITLLTEFTAGKNFEEYTTNAMFRAAVEREFEIIGEAVSQLARLDQRLTDRITDYQRIIAFRNILIHGYADVDNALVWDVVETKLPQLEKQIELLLNEQ